MPTRTRIKICCISSIKEAQLAIAAGADALGLVARMPSGPGPIADELIREIAASVPPPIATFLLTSETSPAAVLAHVRRTQVNTVQLVDDDVSTDVYQALRHEAPAVRIVQVIHVCDEAAIQKALAAATHVDALLLDSGRPRAAVRELGGTGRVHDWALSRAIIENASVPVFLAGGLSASNVQSAIQTTRPFGIDVCSGVRTAGQLDPHRLARFVAAMRAAERSAETSH